MQNYFFAQSSGTLVINHEQFFKAWGRIHTYIHTHTRIHLHKSDFKKPAGWCMPGLKNNNCKVLPTLDSSYFMYLHFGS